MAIRIEPYEVRHEAAVRGFNERVLASGGDFGFSETHAPRWLPGSVGDRLYEEYFVAADGDAVRGAYALKHQDFLACGTKREVGFVYSPLSEGLSDPRYAKVGALLMLNALRRRPLLYCLGMGSMQRPLPRLLAGLKWSLHSVPFYFNVVSARGFLSNLSYVDRIPGARIGRRVAAASGVGALGVGIYKALRSRAPSAGVVSWRLVERFDEAADRIWEQARAGYSFIAVRDAHSLNRLYEKPSEKFIKLVVLKGDCVVGWAVALDTQCQDHSHFGNARLGSLVDGLAVPGCEHEVVHAVTEVLVQRSVDVMVTNQAHRAWRKALVRAGWIAGPSNYIFAASPELAQVLAPFGEQCETAHITRGDGEGPTHL